MCLDKTAKFHLSLYYGDKDKCLFDLTNTLNRYKNCKNSDSAKIKKRIEKYEAVILLIKNTLII